MGVVGGVTSHVSPTQGCTPSGSELLSHLWGSSTAPESGAGTEPCSVGAGGLLNEEAFNTPCTHTHRPIDPHTWGHPHPIYTPCAHVCPRTHVHYTQRLVNDPGTQHLDHQLPTQAPPLRTQGTLPCLPLCSSVPSLIWDDCGPPPGTVCRCGAGGAPCHLPAH